MLISRTSRLAFLTLLATTALAGPAWAATERYASPMGSGNACTAASPCDLQTAITLSNDGDDVAVTPGDYGLTQFYVPPSAITIHGIAGQARPRLLLIGSLQSGWGLPNGTTLRDLEIDQTYPGKATLTTWYAILDRVIIRGAPGADCAVSIFEGNITNSIVVSPGTAICSGASSSSNTSTYRNVTAISTDPGSVAIDVNADGANAFATVLLSNVIAKGGQNGAGFITSTDSSGAHATTSASHTNYANSLTSGTNAVTVDAGGNQGTSPKFVDPAQGDYHEAAGSVTIDAGVDHPGNGPSDLDGDARTIGTTDIGADEFVPPPPPASPPSPPSNAGSGTPSPSPAPADPPSSTSTPPSSTPTPPKARFVGVRLLSTRLSLRHRRITLSLQCPAGTVGRCAGSTLLSARRTTLGRARFSIPAGHRLTVTVRITRAGRGLFASRRRLQAQDSNAARNGVGQSKTTVARVTIRRAR